MQPFLNNLGKILNAIFLAIQDFLSKQALKKTRHPLSNNLPIEVKPPPQVEPPVITVAPAKQEVVNLPPQGSGFLICPIQGNDADGKRLTYRTVKIASVIDHSGTAIQPGSANRWGLVAKDKVVKAFNGEVGDGQPSAGAPYGYTNQVPAPFFANGEINYVGAPGPGDIYGPTYYLNYDGHAGYDFAYPIMTPIQAPADGDLYKAQADLINGVNRSWYLKKFGKDNPTAWEGWHTFLVKHPNGHSSYFLHCTKLADEVESQLTDYQKCVSVKQGQLIAYTGNYGGVPAHLHFEVRNRDGNIVDPFSDKLWL